VTSTAHARTGAALAARRRRTAAMLDRVTESIGRLQRERRPVSFAAVARHSAVSRTFLYENSTARQQVSDAVERTANPRRSDKDDRESGDDQSWRERARNAEDALKAVHAEIRNQRHTIGDLLGRIRDLEADDAHHAVGRLSADNTALHQRVRELTAQNRTLEERLQAARSNSRFLDKRIADLEVRILQQP
jgi:chromosome segregation ATPase